MKQRLSMMALADLMEWTDDQAIKEFAWLRLMSRIKYDGYHDYLAGVRFIETLVTWLRQFKSEDRSTAYQLVRDKLAFVSNAEMRRLVDRFSPREIEPRLVRAAADECAIPWYRVLSDERAIGVLNRLRRQTLFMGLSDGARMDQFRRLNSGSISNEQTVLGPLVDSDKWRDLGKELRNDAILTDVADPKFTRLYLIDDLTASGTTLLRFDQGKKQWKGKLAKLRDALWSARDELKTDFPIAPSFEVIVYHYIATREALESARQLDRAARLELTTRWFSSVEFATGHELDASSKLQAPRDDAYIALASRYYDSAIENRHSEESGVRDMRLGYKGCGLTFVLEHNTPNNSMSLLWAETSGKGGAHAMRPLFRRRSRHV